MTDERWLRDALRRATDGQPVVGDVRADGALHVAAVRRRQRLTLASCTAVLAVFVASSVTGGGMHGLEPVSPPSAPASNRARISDAAGREPSGIEQLLPPEYRGDGAGAQSGAPAGPAAPAGAPRSTRLKIDVYFLFDQTGSMTGYDVNRSAQGIVKALRARGHDVHYGYADVRDIDNMTVLVHGGVYRRIAPVQANPGPFRGNAAGGGDSPDGQTYGLMGATGWTDGLYIRESQPAGFRQGAKRFVVLITDAEMHSGDTNGSPQNYPTIDEAAAALRRQSVRVAPLLVTTSNDIERARFDLERIASGTGARARQMVDCDGDGKYYKGIDVRRGDPLVCTTWSGAPMKWRSYADALIALAR